MALHKRVVLEVQMLVAKAAMERPIQLQVFLELMLVVVVVVQTVIQ